MNVQLHAPAASPPTGEGATLSVGQKAGWTPDPVWTWWRSGKFRFLPWIKPPNPDRLARNQSLYYRSYPSSSIWRRFENKLNIQLRTTDMGLSFSFGVRRRANLLSL